MDYYLIGQRIRKYRKASGLSQEQLAEKIGISVTHLSHIETGNTKLSLPVLCAIADTLSLQTDMLLKDHSSNTDSLRNEIIELLNTSDEKELSVMTDLIKCVKNSLKKYT